MTVHKYFHPVCKVSLYVQPIEYITLIMFLCGRYCLIPKHALYLVRLEIQRKTSKTIFIFFICGRQVCIEEIFVMLTTFLPYTCLTEPVYNFEEGRMAAVSHTGEMLTATHLHFWRIAKPIFLKQLFNSESCPKFPNVSLLSPAWNPSSPTCP